MLSGSSSELKQPVNPKRHKSGLWVGPPTRLMGDCPAITAHSSLDALEWVQAWIVINVGISGIAAALAVGFERLYIGQLSIARGDKG